MVMLTETHVTEEIGHDLFNIRGYNMLSCFSDSRHTGGVMMYLKQDIRWKTLMQKQSDKNWLLAVEVFRGMAPGRYGVLYRSPSGRIPAFLTVLEESWLDDFVDPSKLNVLAGDFNIDWLHEANAANLRTVTDQFGLKQKVREYTRITRTSQTLIDHVFSNCDIDVRTVTRFKISDHETLCISVQKQSDDHEKVMKNVKSWTSYSKRALQDLLREKISPVMDGRCLNDKADSLVQSMTESLEQLVTVKTVNMEEGNTWYNNDLSDAKDKLDRAYETFLQRPKNRTWKKYKSLRNKYSCALRQRKREVTQRSIDENKGNSKQLWKILKRLMRPEPPQSKVVSFGGREEFGDVTIAEKLNKYFLESIKDISDSIEDAVEPVELLNDYTGTRLERLNPISMEKLRSIVWSLDAKAAPDDINSTVLKDAFDQINETLLDIVNESLTTGIVPNRWKESLVIPIAKVQGTVRAEEHRPINMLPLYEKVLELIVKEQLLDYVSENTLLAAEQSGYRKGHSCETALSGSA